jgi:hypothetical protein
VKTNIADAARNRPAGLLPPRDESPPNGMVDGLLRSAIASGIEPAEVADQVLTAILQERFWVLTHPKTKKSVERHMHDIVDDRIPEFDLSKL